MNDTLEYVDYSHNGYTLRQYNTLHYQIIAESGKAVLYASATKELTDDEKKQTIDEFITYQQKIVEKDRIRVCPICGKEFEVSRNRYSYCSVECAKKGKLENEKKAKQIRLMRQKKLTVKPKNTPEKRVCGYCGELFTPSGTYRTYCSNACKFKKRYTYPKKTRSPKNGYMSKK